MTIEATTYQIEFGKLEETSFSKLLQSFSQSKKVIIVDENTHDCCLEFLITQFDELTDAEIILLPAGEENKVMEVCFQVWQALSEYKIGRNDLIINLGGGVVTDMGGFIAALFKRGVKFVNIPTSLLAMVDASVGGKTGIDLGAYKNQIGVFANPTAVYIDHRFLSSLPEAEWVNGYAEMLKHGIIGSKSHWDNLISLQPTEVTQTLIYESVAIKNEIVRSDPTEKNNRKLLNLGHTIGHALEGYLLTTDQKIPHGIAVAWGILFESKIAVAKNILPPEIYVEIEREILAKFPPPPDLKPIATTIFELMLNDKKNDHNRVKCVLPTQIGHATIDMEIDLHDIIQFA